MTASCLVPIQALSGLILCGGQGSRMGSVDKGLELLGQRSLVDHVIARLAPQVGALYINANQNLDLYRTKGYPVVEDAIAGFAGPLAGLHAGMQQCMTPWLLCVPCDSPAFPPDLVARLRHAQEQAHADIAVPCTGTGPGLQQHAAFCLIDCKCLPQLGAYLNEGGRKAQTWYRTLKMVEVPFEDAGSFRNLNTRLELDAYAAELAMSA